MKNKKRHVEINNHIGIYDGYVTDAECDEAITYYQKKDSLNQAYGRLQTENCPLTVKSDTSINLDEREVKVWFKQMKPLLINFDTALRHYQDTTGALSAYGVEQFEYTVIKIQKTLPTQGYHVWHLEHGSDYDNSRRALVFTVYLNDVENGGETEFLNQSVRVKPVKGRCVIWPAGFPYVHRGNPPLQGEKYIMTSWLLLKDTL
tara:strand:+ start:536 stop:1147 length:612 start_codon:yes stop_codon:yes gene_type:complete